LLGTQHKLDADGEVEILVFLKADITWCASIENGEREFVNVLNGLLQLHYSVNSFNDLTTKNACFR